MNPTEFIEWGVVLLAVWFALSFFVGILRTTKRAREAYMADRFPPEPSVFPHRTQVANFDASVDFRAEVRRRLRADAINQDAIRERNEEVSIARWSVETHYPAAIRAELYAIGQKVKP